MRRLRLLVHGAVEAITADSSKRPRGGAVRTLREIAPVTQALENLWRVEDAVKQRCPEPEESDRSLNELRDELYRRLVGLQEDAIAERGPYDAEKEARQRAEWRRAEGL